MRIIPAIDIINGQCVRLKQGDYSQKKIYSDSPLEVAKRFEDAGLKYLHLVDLDGAKAGKIINADILEQICSQTLLEVDFGGGLKSNEDVEIAFSAGASKITAGSISIKQPALVENWIKTYSSDKIILGADIQDDKIMIDGWRTETSYTISEHVAHFQKTGIQEVISTDISVDGMLTGPALELYSKLMEQFPKIRFVASGGVSCVDDLDDLVTIGVDGVIIGKAIYEGKITLKELQKYVD